MSKLLSIEEYDKQAIYTSNMEHLNLGKSISKNQYEMETQNTIIYKYKKKINDFIKKDTESIEQRYNRVYNMFYNKTKNDCAHICINLIDNVIIVLDVYETKKTINDNLQEKQNKYIIDLKEQNSEQINENIELEDKVDKLDENYKQLTNDHYNLQKYNKYAHSLFLFINIFNIILYKYITQFMYILIVIFQILYMMLLYFYLNKTFINNYYNKYLMLFTKYYEILKNINNKEDCNKPAHELTTVIDHSKDIIRINLLKERIKKFYMKWNPEKLTDPDFISKTCHKYIHNEESLFRLLVKRYGNEPL